MPIITDRNNKTKKHRMSTPDMSAKQIATLQAQRIEEERITPDISRYKNLDPNYKETVVVMNFDTNEKSIYYYNKDNPKPKSDWSDEDIWVVYSKAIATLQKRNLF